VNESDHSAKQEALKRLSEPEGDHELYTALEPIREHHPRRLRCVVRKLVLVPDASAGPRLPAHALPRWTRALAPLAAVCRDRSDSTAGGRPSRDASRHVGRRRFFKLQDRQPDRHRRIRQARGTPNVRRARNTFRRRGQRDGQPAHVSLWMRPDLLRRGRRKTRRFARRRSGRSSQPRRSSVS